MLERLVSLLEGTSASVSMDPPLSPLLADVAQPLAEPNPCGRDVSYESDFLRLKQEIDKLNAIDTRVDQARATALGNQLRNAGGRALERQGRNENANGSDSTSRLDAELVISLARSILKDQSKDLRVVCYLMLGLARRDGLSGVAEGTRAIELVVGSFWNGLFPPLSRMAGRMNAIEAGIGWLREAVDRAKPTATDRDALERAHLAVIRLRELSAAWDSERVTQRLAALATSLSDASAKVPSDSAPTPGAARSASLPRAANAAESIERSVAVPVSADAPALSPTHAIDAVVGAANWLLKEDVKRPLPYRLLRACRWDPLVQDPPNDRKRTRIEPPPVPRRDYLTRLHNENRWADLVVEAEGSFSQHPFHFWLDLQRFVLDALGALGTDFTPARDAVSKELQLLLTRLPGLWALTFADGTRFAAPATVSWLEEVAKPLPGAVGGAVRPGRAETVSDGDRYADARKRFSGGDLNGALALLERGAAEDGSDRQRFQRRAYMASLCLEAGQLPVARALLEELAQVIEQHGLARWEPDLAMAVWTRQYTCYAALASRIARGPDVEHLGREMERVFGQICRVDAIRALATAQEVRRPP